MSLLLGKELGHNSLVLFFFPGTLLLNDFMVEHWVRTLHPYCELKYGFGNSCEFLFNQSPVLHPEHCSAALLMPGKGRGFSRARVYGLETSILEAFIKVSGFWEIHWLSLGILLGHDMEVWNPATKIKCKPLHSSRWRQLLLAACNKQATRETQLCTWWYFYVKLHAFSSSSQLCTTWEKDFLFSRVFHLLEGLFVQRATLQGCFCCRSRWELQLSRTISVEALFPWQQNTMVRIYCN